MKIAVIGSGYVGLVTAACLADMGNTVIGLDISAEKVAMLQAGKMPIHEPGLDAIVLRNQAAGRLTFTTSHAEALASPEVIFIAVGTPPGEDGSADLSHVIAAARQVGKFVHQDVVVVDKSTVPVGTADAVRGAIADELAGRASNLQVHVVSNPEFLKEGAAIADFMRPDRIVIGADSPRAVEVMRQVYAPFCRNHDKLIVMDTRSAELTKYAANAMLATRISFMNELALLAEKVGADIEQVRKGIGSDPRIGPSFLYAGAGYGGSCFPKDVKALIHTAQANGAKLQVLTAVEAANDRQKHVLGERITGFLGADLTGKTIALWGLAFKPDTDDMREAPAMVLVHTLLAAGASIQAYDPVAAEVARSAVKREVSPAGQARVRIVDSARAACEGADVLALITEWKEFRSPDFLWLAATLKAKAVFDGRNQYVPSMVAAYGLKYFGIGRGA